jgi:hypothetical protein
MQLTPIDNLCQLIVLKPKKMFLLPMELVKCDFVKKNWLGSFISKLIMLNKVGQPEKSMPADQPPINFKILFLAIELELDHSSFHVVLYTYWGGFLYFLNFFLTNAC